MCPRWNPFSGRGVTNCRTGAAEEKRNPKIAKKCEAPAEDLRHRLHRRQKRIRCVQTWNSLSTAAGQCRAARRCGGERKGHPVVCLMTLLAWKTAVAAVRPCGRSASRAEDAEPPFHASSPCLCDVGKANVYLLSISEQKKFSLA